MKAGVYVAGHAKKLSCYMSLDLNVDRCWWGLQQARGTEAVFFRLISRGMPLQWATALAGLQLNAHIPTWTNSDWSRYIRSGLGRMLNEEDLASFEHLSGIVEFDEAQDAAMPVLGNPLNEATASTWLRQLHDSAGRLIARLNGRSLLGGEVESMLKELDPALEKQWRSVAQFAYLQGTIKLENAVKTKPRSVAVRQGLKNVFGLGSMLAEKSAHQCMRCGSAADGGPCGSCGSSDCARCEACRALGRSRSCEVLVSSMQQEGCAASDRGLLRGQKLTQADLRARLTYWNLSPAQTEASEQAVRFLESPIGSSRSAAAKQMKRRRILRIAIQSNTQRPDTSGYAAQDPSSRFLLWAVTGAGKTEMLFPLIEHVRSQGGRVLVATPRRDVVLELAPRLRKAFPDETLVALYGGSEERWRRGGVTLATTHQVLRFDHAFDLVVIDELDAFPFHGDPMLAYAAERCRAAGGRTVYLSATPPKELQSLVRKGHLACAKVPVRYHRYPLPVPMLLRMSSLSECLRKKRLPDVLLRKWRVSLERGAQVFIFVPKIAFAEPLAALLRVVFPGIAVGATSSQDEERGGKVSSFRATDLRMLVTTTILERGVTVPRSDVYILDADSGLFDEASLVQMAGRAGRSADDPAGKVVFAAVQKTKAQVGARRQIRRMNRLARPFLLPRHARKSSESKR
ncbi:DEAD/DEAH box helicase [Saccharibacillus sacchari]|uniref:DEAD/DEAH box helicase n=1 Tax=Saccharibacillus sacchari TaxID=456493 RepID=UPI0004B427C9|nr:DNA/RNA helicase [Saccharibacillus sacchari]